MQPALFLNGRPVRGEAPRKDRTLPECRAEDVVSETEAQGSGYMSRAYWVFDKVWGVGQDRNEWLGVG